MQRRTAFLLAAVLVVLLAVSVFLQVWLLPREIENATTNFPETEPLAIPGFIWGVTAIACCQAIVLIGFRLVVLAYRDVFVESATAWMRAIVGCLLLFFALIVLAFTALAVMGYSSPAQFELAILGILALIAIGCLIAAPTTRRPWRKASQSTRSAEEAMIPSGPRT